MHAPTAIGSVLRTLGHAPAGGSAPGEPDLTIVNDGTGTSVTATVDGDAGVTNTLYYRQADEDDWTQGSARAGDGDIQQTGLSNDTWYEMVCISTSGGVKSVPSNPVGIYCTDDADPDITNSFWGPLERLRTMLANCDTWQTWTGATGGTEAERIAAAKEHIYIPVIPRVDGEEYPTTVADARPYALIDQGATHGRDSVSTGPRGLPSGSILLMIAADTPDAVADDPSDAQQSFMGNVGDVLDELDALAGTSSHLALRSWELINGPFRSDDFEEASGDYWEVVYEISWSV
ncbi:MAG: hypothetical protein PVH68_04760 [Armatimonadota bacterium]|jgi:hypothetical protein